MTLPFVFETSANFHVTWTSVSALQKLFPFSPYDVFFFPEILIFSGCDLLNCYYLWNFHHLGCSAPISLDSFFVYKRWCLHPLQPLAQSVYCWWLLKLEKKSIKLNKNLRPFLVLFCHLLVASKIRENSVKLNKDLRSFLVLFCHLLKSVHFKKPVTRISFLSNCCHFL